MKTGLTISTSIPVAVLSVVAFRLIGVLCMIPLRRYLIVREHGKLPYPEGMACAEVLVAAEQGGRQAANVFRGLGFGMLAKQLTSGLKLIPGKFHVALPWKGHLAVGVSPALIGVGYILGIRIATVMVAGSALSALVIVPAIYLWGMASPRPSTPRPST